MTLFFFQIKKFAPQKVEAVYLRSLENECSQPEAAKLMQRGRQSLLFPVQKKKLLSEVSDRIGPAFYSSLAFPF